MVRNEKSSRGLTEESETHPDIISSAIIEGGWRYGRLNIDSFFGGHPVGC